MNDVYRCKQSSLCRAPDNVFVFEIVLSLTQAFEKTFTLLHSAWNALNQRILHLRHVACKFIVHKKIDIEWASTHVVQKHTHVQCALGLRT